MNEHSFSSEKGPRGFDKRREILQAALEIIAEQGFHGAPMADISERARVAAGTIYRYFENKDVLIRELHAELEEEMGALLSRDFPHAEPLRERFLYLIKTVLGYLVAHPMEFRFLEQFFNSPYGISLHRERLLNKSGKSRILLDLFEEGIREGVIKDLPQPILFALAFGPVVMLVRDHIAGFVVLDAALMDRIALASWDAIKS